MSASSRPCWVTAGIALIVIWLTIITLKLFSHDTVAVLSEEAWPEQWRAPQGEFIDYQVKPDVAVAVLVERRADDGDLGVDHDEAAAAILPEKDPLDDRGLVRGIPNAAQQHPNITLFIICIRYFKYNFFLLDRMHAAHPNASSTSLCKPFSEIASSYSLVAKYIYNIRVYTANIFIKFH